MKIVHIFISLPVGGAEDLVLSLVRHQSIAQRTEILCLRELGVAGEEAVREGLPVTLLPCARSKRLSLIGIWRIARWLRNQGVDVVHSHVYNAHVYAVLAAAIAGIPSIIHHHKTFKRDRLHRLVLLRILSRLAAAQIALSETTRRELIAALQIRRERFHVFENRVDTSIFHSAQDKRTIRRELGIDEHAFILGAVASLTSPKNHSATIEMFSALRAKGIEVKGIICGEGKLRPVLQEQIDRLRLQPHLELVGNKRPITPWLQAMDFLVLPSRWEGQPMILLQAMACNIPIIASDIEGNVAALGAEHPGLFDKNSLAQYIERTEQFHASEDLKARILSYQKDFFRQKPSFPSYAQNLNALYDTLSSIPVGLPERVNSLS